jgi:threo-3-hydroxy-L-aspartate ammonia-lyase
MELKEFREARERIAPYLHPTPLIKSDALQKYLKYESPIFLKLESEQPTGSFKVRGAFNALLQLDPSIDRVVAFSSGNFAQAVAYGAKILKKQATIVMPKNAPRKKIEGTQSLGAEIIFCGDRHEEGQLLVNELVEKEGYFALHPFDNYHTIAGQGTIALEILASNCSFSHFFSPVGGGGLLSGCASVLRSCDNPAAIYSVEPLGAHDFYESFRERRHIAFEKTNTIADGLRAVSVGQLNYPILMSTVDKALAVTEETIIKAMRLLLEHHLMVVEPSGAVALAGFLSNYQTIEGGAVILITGKNVDSESFNLWTGHN